MPRLADALLAVLLGAALALALQQVAAAPRAQGQAECVALWDASLVARALAITGHDIAASNAVIRLIYSWQGDVRIEAIVAAIVQAAQTDTSATAGDFAARVARACIERGGDMDAVLGVSS